MNRDNNQMGHDLNGLTEEGFLQFCKSRSFDLDSYNFGKKVVSFHSFTGMVLSPERREREKISSHYGQHPGLDSHRLYVTSKTEVDSHFWLFDPLAGELEIDLPKLDVPLREGQLITVVYGSAYVSKYWRKPELDSIAVGLVNHSTQGLYQLASPNQIRDALKLRDHLNVPTLGTFVLVLGAWLGSLALNDQALVMIFGTIALLYALMARLYLLFNMPALPALGFTFDWPMFYLEHKSGLEGLLNRHLTWLADPTLVKKPPKVVSDSD